MADMMRLIDVLKSLHLPTSPLEFAPITEIVYALACWASRYL
jgi:hypothetical protein